MAETPREHLARRLADYPNVARGYFNAGFIAAARLSKDERDRVLAELVKSFQSGVREVSSSAIAQIASVEAKAADRIGLIYSITIGMLSETSATPEDFVATASGVLFEPAQQGVALEIATAICAHRDSIKAAVERAQLSGMVLPSLSAFEVAVDIRVRMSDGKITAAVPVTVAHIDTDGDRQELWVQLSTGDIENITKKLTDCLDEMRQAERAILALK